ncbi:phosphodiester glycosidase family protein [Paenibacillus lentus]|uniref:phosphodiester glycosidase family protein n=1 Tax=Paenibacillus lentus TaxID=1338368 RepID=UPI003656EAD3
MSEAKYVSTTHNSKAVRYIEADLDAIKVESISGKSVEESGKYGINGTFFSGTTLTGIAVNRMANGLSAKVANNGDTTTGVTYEGSVYSSQRGTMYYFDPAAGIHFFDTKPVKSYLDYPNSSTSNVVWAIGGYSLHPTKAYSSSDDYYNDINGSGAVDKKPTANSENAYRFSPKSATARTAIGYRYINQKRKIILAVFDNQTAWAVREFMAGLGCTFAIMLDGGGSSQIRYKSGGSNGFWCPKPDTTMRKVHSMVTVNATTWL